MTNEALTPVHDLDVDLHLDVALRWVVDALLDGAIDHSAAFFELDPPSQFLALQALRTSARAALALSSVAPADFVAQVTAAHRRWLVGPS